MTRLAIRTLTLVLLAATLSSCAATQQRPGAGTLDIAWQRVRSGQRALDGGEVNRAEREFDQALAAAPGFAPALAGKALAEGARRFYPRAKLRLSQADHAARTPEERMFLSLAWLQFHELRLHEPGVPSLERRQIIEDARTAFRAALSIQPRSLDASYRMGRVYEAALEFDAAGEMFYRVLSSPGVMGARARREWELLQQIRQLSPRTRTARRVALSERLTWGQTAALLTEEFELRDQLARLGRRAQPGFETPGEYTLANSNVTARNANDLSHPLATVAGMGVRGLETRGPLNPAKPMTRGVFALILEDVLVKLAGDKSLPVRFIGRPSGFSDVRPDHYTYNAIVVTTTLKLVSPVSAGEFGLLEPVSGIEALAALQRLREILRLPWPGGVRDSVPRH